MFLGMECSERLFLLQSEEIATFARGKLIIQL